MFLHNSNVVNIELLRVTLNTKNENGTENAFLYLPSSFTLI